MRLDDDTRKFIGAWVVPLVRKVALDMDTALANAEAVAAAPSTLGGFHISANPTQNIRDKVSWNPMTHSWEVLLKKAKGSPKQQFVVDPDLASSSYEKAKAAAYHDAIAAWNSLDGSNRHRIPVALCKGGVPK